ncbi:MAG: bacillithiol biosynthesis BshC, partial [Bacteroidota bacterium]
YEMFENVLTQAKGIDSSLESWIHAERKKQLEQWDAIQNKLNKAIQRKEEDVFSKLTSIQKFFMPAGKSQERVLTLLEASFYFNLNDLKETLINQDPENLEHLFLS